MGIELFLKKLKKKFGIDFSKDKTKKESLLLLIGQLSIKLKKIKKKLKYEIRKKKKEELLEEKEIIKLQIKKANKVLKKLDK